MRDITYTITGSTVFEYYHLSTTMPYYPLEIPNNEQTFLKLKEATDNSDLKAISGHFQQFGTKYLNDIYERACEIGDLEVVKFCLTQNDLDINTGFAFDSALRAGHEELTLLLIHSGVDWPKNRRKTIMSAVCYGHLRLLKFLYESAELSESEFRDMLSLAAAEGQLKILKVLIAKMNEPNGVCAGVVFMDDSALMSACFRGHSDVAIYLIEVGSLSVPISITALGWAAFNDLQEVVRTIIDVQKPGNVQLAFPVYMAIQRQRFAIIDFLVGQNVPIDQDIIAAIQENFKEDLAVKWERLIEYVADYYPKFRCQVAAFFTPKLNQKYPEYRTGLDFNLI